MNRLTRKSENNAIHDYEPTEYGNDLDRIDLLGKYEDTGFEPEDILSNIKTLSGELNNAFEELKVYRNLEEQGLLIKLPMQLGELALELQDNILEKRGIFIDYGSLNSVLETLQEMEGKLMSEKNCDTCKYFNGEILISKANAHCLKCMDFDEWESKEEIKSKMKIILLSGKAFSGKDSAANMMKTKLESNGKKVLIAHYGDLVKYTCKTFFGWNGEKDEQGRTLLQEIGTDRIRAKRPNFWVSYIRNILEIFENEWNYVLIPDTRFPNEIDLMKNTFDDVTSVCVVRTNFVSPLTEEQRNHKSETALDDRIFDYYLVADDLEKLERKVDVFLEDKLCN